MIFHQGVDAADSRTGRTAGFLLILAAVLVLATPSFAQAPTEKADKVSNTKEKQSCHSSSTNMPGGWFVTYRPQNYSGL